MSEVVHSHLSSKRKRSSKQSKVHSVTVRIIRAIDTPYEERLVDKFYFCSLDKNHRTMASSIPICRRLLWRKTGYPPSLQKKMNSTGIVIYWLYVRKKITKKLSSGTGFPERWHCIYLRGFLFGWFLFIFCCWFAVFQVSLRGSKIDSTLIKKRDEIASKNYF